MVVTVVPNRPTCTLAVTNTGAVSHLVSVVRSRGVADNTRVRWASDVTVGAGATFTVTDDEGPIATSFTYDLFVDGSFQQSGGGFTDVYSGEYLSTFDDTYGDPITSTSAIFHAGPWYVDGFPTKCWLRHLTYPSLSRPVLIESWPSTGREGNYGELLPLGAGLPVVTFYPRSGRKGTVTLITLGINTASGVDALISDGSILQLATDPAFGVLGDGVYMAVNDANEERVTDDGTSVERSWPLAFIEVDAPPALGGQGGLTTYAQLAAAYVTYGALRNTARTNNWTYRTLLDGDF